jgi:hypothetical protein
MATFIVRSVQDEPPADDVQRIRDAPGLKVLDATPRMFLVEANKDSITYLKKELPDWIITREGSTPRPRTRRRVDKPPEE